MDKFVELENEQCMPIIGNNTEVLEAALGIALATGYRHFDTAHLYKNESTLGRVLQRWLEMGKVTREELFIVTKLPPQGNHHERVADFLQQSLDNLQLDYVDLYLIHQPATLQVAEDGISPKRESDGSCILDLSTSLEETWKVMEEQVDLVKSRAIGLSSYSAEQVERICEGARIKPAVLQVELNAHYPKKKLRKVCEANGVGVCAFAAFGSPGRKAYFVSKKFVTEDEVDSKVKIPDLLDNPVVLAVAEKHDKTNGQVLLRFLAQQEIVVLTKSVNEERIKSNFQIFDLGLDSDDMSKLDLLDSGKEGSWAYVWKSASPGIENHPEFQLNDD